MKKLKELAFTVAAIAVVFIFVRRNKAFSQVLCLATMTDAEKTREKVRKLSEGEAYQPPNFL